MKKPAYAILVLLSLSLPVAGIAQKKAAAAKATKEVKAVKEDNEIHWITSIDELQAKMAQSPRKVIVDMYTGWCGWCKKMDAATYSNPALVKYVNNNFYAVKFDAERQDAFTFQGKEYHFDPQYKSHTFAVELMKGSMSYPTTVFMVENFQSPTPVPGYRDVKEMQLFLTYFGDNIFKRQRYEDYSKSFTATWDHGQAADMSAPAGH